MPREIITTVVVHTRLSLGLLIAALTLVASPPVQAQGLTEDQVLLLYNSANTDSLQVHDMYLAAHPGVLQFDLNDPSLSPIEPANLGNITRAEYLGKIRAPLLQYLSGLHTNGTPLSQQVISIATTRGLPARIQGINEFQLYSSMSSLESELSLVQQDLTLPGPVPYNTIFEGVIDNPYHFQINKAIVNFDRSAITQQKSFIQNFFVSAWEAADLTPGDMYLVCRLDSAPSANRTAIQNIQALISRSQTLAYEPANVQALLDEYSPQFDQLDNDGGVIFPVEDDFTNTTTVLEGEGITTLHDETFNFVTGPEMPDQVRPIIVLGTYGENHNISGWGENPPGVGTYISTYTNIHPAGMFIAYESFNGNSIVNGLQRSDHGQALDFIAAGGSFTIAHVAEPFSFTVADLEMLTQNLLRHGMTFAEAAYSSIPTLSWQSTPIGDPLATITLGLPPLTGDFNGDGVVNAADLAILLSNWGTNGGGSGSDITGDGIVNSSDLAQLLANWTG